MARHTSNRYRSISLERASKRRSHGNEHKFKREKAHKHSHKKRKDSKKDRKTDKRKHNKRQTIELHVDVLNMAVLYKERKVRLVLQESSQSPLIVGAIKKRRGKHLEFKDSLHIDAKVVRKDDKGNILEVKIKKLLEVKKNGAKSDIRRHSISSYPFCSPPKTILEAQNPKIKKAVVMMMVNDVEFRIFDSCRKCHAMWDWKKQKCILEECEAQERGWSVFGEMLGRDATGLKVIQMEPAPLEKYLAIFGFTDRKGWLEFQQLHEARSIDLGTMAVEITKGYKDVWECTDIEPINWEDYEKFRTDEGIPMEA